MRRRAGGASASVSRPDRLPRLEWSISLATTILAAALYATFLFNAGALWRDEVNSVNVASATSLSMMWRSSEFDSFPILWLLLLRAWIATGIGATDVGLRVFGVMGGVALVGAIWFAAWRLGQGVPLVSLALLAVNPVVVRWGASVRAWGLGAALLLVSLVSLKAATDSPTPRSVVLAALAAILSVQTLFHNAVLLAAIVAGCVAIAVARREWTHALVPIVIGVVAAISLLPYVATIGRVNQWSTLVQVP